MTAYNKKTEDDKGRQIKSVLTNRYPDNTDRNFPFYGW